MSAMAAAQIPHLEAKSPASPRERAAFAVMSRLISCLVTEQILPALYFASDFSVAAASGYLVVLSSSSESTNLTSGAVSPDDIFVIVPLHHAPMYKDDLPNNFGRAVGLVDPLDMLPYVYQLADAGQMVPHSNSIVSSLPPFWTSAFQKGICRIEDPLQLWMKFTTVFPVDYPLCDDIGEELTSSFVTQMMVFENPPWSPTLHSPSIVWEQSLVTGHPTHPMHRARLFNSKTLEYDWYHPLIRFIRVPRGNLEAKGDFERLSGCLCAKAAENAGRVLQDDPALIYMPVHELQIENIRSRVENLQVLDPEISLRAQAQSSIRTLEIAEFPDMAFKLSIGVKISSALRTISHFTADFGPRFSRDIVPKLAVNPEILRIEVETSSAVYRTADPEVAKHFTAVIREKFRPPNGQAVIVVAALLDMGHAGLDENVSVIEHVFELDSEKKKEAFLKRYIQLACQALIPPLIKNGVGFEAHAQNVLAQFDIASKQLQGFIVRDLGGLRIHPPTLHKSTGVDFHFLDGHVVATKTLEEIFPKFYHTFIHNHLQRLIRLLRMHYNGRGWEMVRKYMAEVIPVEHPVWKQWMDPASRTVDSKSLMRMRIRDSYREMVYAQIPNLIQHHPLENNF